MYVIIITTSLLFKKKKKKKLNRFCISYMKILISFYLDKIEQNVKYLPFILTSCLIKI